MLRSTLPPIVALFIFVLAGCRNGPVAMPPLALAERTESGALAPVTPDRQADYELDLTRRLTRPIPPDEVYTLRRQSTWGGPAEVTEVTVTAGRATLRVFDTDDRGEREFRRDLDPAELADLRSLATRADRLPPLSFQGWDGVDYFFVHGTASAGLRRLHINNPPVEDDVPAVFPGDNTVPRPDPLYAQIVRTMRKLANPDRLTVRYDLRRPPDGFAVVFAHPHIEVRNVWARGDDVRVIVGAPACIDDRGWRKVAAINKLADGEAARPPDVPADDWPEEAIRSRKLQYDTHADGCEPWQARVTGRSVHGLGNRRSGSTWLFDEGAKPAKLLDRMAHFPILSEDGRWLVASVDERLVRYDLTERKLLPFTEPDELARYLPLRRVQGTGKVLLVRHHPHPLGRYGWEEFRLLDPATGQATEARPESDVWLKSMRRPYQPTSKPGVTWVAFPSASTPAYTMVGRYDMANLRFLNWQRIDSLSFDSDRMWVDEAVGLIYAVHRGQLVRVRLDPRVIADEFSKHSPAR